MLTFNCTHGPKLQRFLTYFALTLLVVPSSTWAIFASQERFSVPEDLALRIRLDDTLTSTDSQAGDPFSATVVDEGTYQNARV